MAGRGPDGRLTLVGQVASGFSDVERRRLYALLVKIPRARPQVAHEKQIRGVHWVDPVYTGEVAFREYVPGRGLSSFLERTARHRSRHRRDATRR